MREKSSTREALMKPPHPMTSPAAADRESSATSSGCRVTRRFMLPHTNSEAEMLSASELKT